MYNKSDQLANVISVTGVTSVLMEWQLPLTILLLLSGITLNVVRIYVSSKKKED
tara:strand:- start:1356 stop:1517 length:162 start_codon:yes stop_codon:yes gene_type:complete